MSLGSGRLRSHWWICASLLALTLSWPLPAWADTLPRFAKRPAALDAARYERFSQFMKDAGLIREVPPVESYAVELR